MFAKFKEQIALFIETSKAAYEISSNPLYMMFNKTVVAGKEVYIDNKVVLANTGVKQKIRQLRIMKKENLRMDFMRNMMQNIKKITLPS